MVESKGISKEAAEEQLEIFKDYYEIDEEYFVPETAMIMNQRLAEVNKAIRKGRLEISNAGGLKIKQRLRNTTNGVDELNYSVLTGKAKVQMDKSDGAHSRNYTLMSSLANEPYATFEKLEGVDMSLVESLGALFLAV